MPGNSIKYLGIVIDSHLNWKSQVSYISKKLEEIFAFYLKCVTMSISKLLQTYMTLLYISIFDIWNYCLGEHLQINVNTNYTLHKLFLGIVTFSNYNDHSNPHFKAFEIIKFEDITYLHNAIFMYDFHSGTLPPAFFNAIILQLSIDGTSTIQDLLPGLPIHFLQ